MRVLHVIPSISPRRGGPSEVVRRLAEAQRRLGLEVEIATSDEDAREIRDGEPADSPQLTIHFFPRRFTGCRLMREYAFCPTFASWLRRQIATYDILHVHALFSHLPTTAMCLARRMNVPYISRPLGQLGRWPLRQSAWKKAAYLQLIEKRNIRGASAIHFTSLAEREEAADLKLGTPGIIVPHGVTMPPLNAKAPTELRQKIGVAPDQKLVLFLGRLHAKKGLDLLLIALALLPAPRPLLLVAGEGPAREALLRQAGELGIAADVLWLGQIADEWKQLCLAGVDAFALTSHHENFGVAVLEALAAGTPVLVSPAVALADMIARHELGWIAPLDPPAIAATLGHILATDTPAQRIRRRSFVEMNFSWAASARALAEVYQGAVKSR
jgi:glycosyltransferase involved in cell wall biosynthesis